MSVQSPSKNSRRKYGRFAIAIAMALVISVVAVFQVPQVSSYAQSVMKKVGGYVNIFNIEGSPEEVKMVGTYVKIKNNASRDFEQFDTLGDVEAELGIQLLKYDKSTEVEGAWNYSPAVSGDKQISEVHLRNASYILGDLKEVNIKDSGVISEENKAAYKKGEKFKSPIIGYVAIRTGADSGEVEEGEVPQEISYIRDIENDANAKRVHCKNLDTEILLSYSESDGLAVWGDANIKRMTFMYFIYEDIEYSFSGDVSYAIMMKIAEELHY